MSQTDRCRGAARVGFGSGAVFDKFNRIKGFVLRLYSETVQDANKAGNKCTSQSQHLK